MKLRQIIIAASVMAFANLTSAQTSTDASTASVKADPNTQVYADPIVQKRNADHVARAEYKAAKKASKKKMNEEKAVAKAEMKADKKEAKAEMKADKKEANAVMKASLAASPAASESAK